MVARHGLFNFTAPDPANVPMSAACSINGVAHLTHAAFAHVLPDFTALAMVMCLSQLPARLIMSFGSCLCCLHTRPVYCPI